MSDNQFYLNVRFGSIADVRLLGANLYSNVRFVPETDVRTLTKLTRRSRSGLVRR